MTTPRLTFLALTGLTFLAPGTTPANPSGEQVQSGEATFNRTPGMLTVLQQSRNLSVGWHDFSIGIGETTRFVQPSSDSIVVNRVTSGNPSLLYGSLQANGRVFLLNPNGILVGPNGVINTHSFMGATLDVSSDQLFKGEKLTLAGDSKAPIRNEGAISALGGSVYLFAHTVENTGAIRAAEGQVVLGAASEVIVHDTKGSIDVVVRNPDVPKAEASPSEVGIQNSGSIEAVSAQLHAAGGNVYALAINNSGVVRANSLVRENGRLLLKATGGQIRNSGTLAARTAQGQGGSIQVDAGQSSGSPSGVVNQGTLDVRGEGASGLGGKVEIRGQRLALADGSLIDASGEQGGGTVRVGGLAHGVKTDSPNAETAVVASGATVRADALRDGRGGEVVVWADQSAEVHGTLSARGGVRGGNGGFIETSGRQSLDVAGANVSTAASFGRGGKWLLDPTNFEIDLGVARSLENALNNGTSVEITTGEAATGGDLGDLTVTAPIAKTTGGVAELSLVAHHDIDLRQSISLQNGSVRLRAGNDITGSGSLAVDGDIQLAAGNDVTAKLGTSTPGTLFLTARNANITSEGSTVLGLSTISGNLTLHSAGNISQSGVLTVGQDVEFRITDPSARHSIILSEVNNLQGRFILGDLESLTLPGTFLGTRVLDLTLVNQGLPTDLALGTSPFRDVTLKLGGGDLILPSITAVGRLDVAATSGNISQGFGTSLIAHTLTAQAPQEIRLLGENRIEHLSDITAQRLSLKVTGDIDQTIGTRLRVENGLALEAQGTIRLDQENELKGLAEFKLSLPNDPSALGKSISVKNVGSLTLGEILLPQGDLELHVEGDLEQVAGSKVVAKNAVVQVAQGDAHLTQVEASGDLRMEVSGTGTGRSSFGVIKAQDLTLEVAGDVVQIGTVEVSRTAQLQVDGDLEQGPGTKITAETLDLRVSQGSLSLNEVDVSNGIRLEIGGVNGGQSSVGSIKAGQLEMNAVQNSLRLGNLQVSGAASISVGGDFDQILDTKIQAGNLELLAAGGNIRLREVDVSGGLLNIRTDRRGDPSKGNVSQVSDSTPTKIVAKQLRANVAGNLLLGINDLKNPEAAPAHKNEFEQILAVNATGGIGIYDYSAVAGDYNQTTGEFISTGLKKDKVLALEIAGPVAAGGGVVFRAAGDISIRQGGSLSSPNDKVVLSAELVRDRPGLLPSSADFHNFGGPEAIRPGTRFTIYSTRAVNNFPVSDAQFTTVTFGGLGAGRLAGQRSTLDPYDILDAPPSGPLANNVAFVFKADESFIVPDEGTKYVVDIVRVKPVTPVTFSPDISRLPVPELGNIYTSSYHVYAEEARSKKSKVKSSGTAATPTGSPTLAMQEDLRWLAQPDPVAYVFR